VYDVYIPSHYNNIIIHMFSVRFKTVCSRVLLYITLYVSWEKPKQAPPEVRYVGNIIVIYNTTDRDIAQTNVRRPARAS